MKKFSNFSMDQFSPYYWKKIIISSKTSLDIVESRRDIPYGRIALLRAI
jgi:hypothetical protein